MNCYSSVKEYKHYTTQTVQTAISKPVPYLKEWSDVGLELFQLVAPRIRFYG